MHFLVHGSDGWYVWGCGLTEEYLLNNRPLRFDDATAFVSYLNGGPTPSNPEWAAIRGVVGDHV